MLSNLNLQGESQINISLIFNINQKVLYKIWEFEFKNEITQIETIPTFTLIVSTCYISAFWTSLKNSHCVGRHNYLLTEYLSSSRPNSEVNKHSVSKPPLTKLISLIALNVTNRKPVSDTILSLLNIIDLPNFSL